MPKIMDLDCKGGFITVMKYGNKINEIVIDYGKTGKDSDDELVVKKGIARKEALSTAQKFGCNDAKVETLNSWLSGK